MWGTSAGSSRAIVDNGTTAVTATTELDAASHVVTRFGALVDGTDQVIDLTEDRGLHCPLPNAFCRILTWPDGSIGTDGNHPPAP
ncbi:hypothetical protein [Dactylosporangium matsuzakiense]|uniref:Uncharacterized protein n=1 Tax=Dactylosporangium matsuzakiense TaxID=53360 RepID=A0A9W6KXF4_9ACTN|nr:hypothetical protein [Dactylosporangium matsuzakiense]UWZ47767.1 hypothetical protein Dmats_16000 [Dactylosporangium matsuzakiense]GLL08464.1 hypothetical protein GCM10017581_102270 [Dactylosporangium matsuzakiense]